MKLYDFEKYYLHFVRYKLFIFLDKVISFFEKIWKHPLGQVLLILTFYIIVISIAGLIFVYFFLGFNLILDKIGLGQYKIMDFQLMQVHVDLKPFYNQ